MLPPTPGCIQLETQGCTHLDTPGPSAWSTRTRVRTRVRTRALRCTPHGPLAATSSVEQSVCILMPGIKGRRRRANMLISIARRTGAHERSNNTSEPELLGEWAPCRRQTGATGAHIHGASCTRQPGSGTLRPPQRACACRALSGRRPGLLGGLGAPGQEREEAP